MERFGDYLKAQREKKNIRLEEIASITKIHLHSLELLEANQWEQLPPEPFIRGFITAYAKYVGLDAKETVALYMEAVGQKIVPVTQATEAGANQAPQNPSEVIQGAWEFPFKKIALVGGSLLVVLLLGTFIYLGKNQTEESSGRITENRPQPAVVAESSTRTEGESTNATAEGVSPNATANSVDDNRNIASPSQTASTTPGTADAVTPPVAENKPEASSTLSNSTEKVETAAKTTQLSKSAEAPKIAPAIKPEANAKVAQEVKPNMEKIATAQNQSATPASTSDQDGFSHDVSVEGKTRTWIKVVIDDKMPIEYFLPKGEKANYQAKQKIKIVLGDSTGAVVTHNGNVNSGKKFKGTIYSYIFPSNARFPQDAPKRDTTAEGQPSEPNSASAQ